MNSEEIERILEQFDIIDIGIDLFGDRIKPQKYGSSYKGLCPFHSEKKPSFFLRSNQNVYICYACGIHGGPVGLIINRLGLSSGIEYIIKKENLQVLNRSEFSGRLREFVADEYFNNTS